MMAEDKKKRVAIVPGSFDPITVGHTDILRRASLIFDEVWLALMVNPSKEYFFESETRLELARSAALPFPNVKVIYDEGMLWELVLRLGCDAIIKGIRNGNDLEYEVEMASFNREKSGIETLFLPSLDPVLCEVSSTLVRSYLESGELQRAEALMPKGAMDIIKKRGYK